MTAAAMRAATREAVCDGCPICEDRAAAAIAYAIDTRLPAAERKALRHVERIQHLIETAEKFMGLVRSNQLFISRQDRHALYEARQAMDRIAAKIDKEVEELREFRRRATT